MSNLSVFSFRSNDASSDVRVIESDGKAWFVAADVAKILGYAQTNSMNKLIDDEDKSKHTLQSGGNYINQSLINESGLYQAIFGSTKPEAKAFKRWVTSEVLPSIRKTGSYMAQPVSGTLEDKVRAAGEIAKVLNLTGSSLSGALRRTVAKLDADLLPMFPEYSIDAPVIAGQSPAESSETTLSLTELLKRNGSPIGAVKANKILIQLGILEEKMRPGRKGEQRKFKCITQKGLKYGKNVVTEQSPLETQPHWFECQFSDLLALMLGAQEKKAA